MFSNRDEFELVHSAIENEMAFSLAAGNEEAWMQAFIALINDLILHDFNRLVLLLYRVDISEATLVKLLKEQSTPEAPTAAEIICRLIIQRQKEKIKTREEFRRDDEISEEEKW